MYDYIRGHGGYLATHADMLLQEGAQGLPSNTGLHERSLELLS